MTTKNPRQPDEFLTIAELAAWLKIPTQTLYGWNSRGGGPKVTKVGRHVRYRRSDVEAWLDGTTPPRMTNAQVAETILARLALTHGPTINYSHEWLNTDEHIDPEGWKIKQAYALITGAARTCVALGDLDDTWRKSPELNALINTIAARITL